jgi:hypothetical protein
MTNPNPNAASVAASMSDSVRDQLARKHAVYLTSASVLEILEEALASAPQQAQAEFDALAADAARYRWLRSAETGHCKVGRLFEVVGDGGQFSLKCTEELDAAIDAAMKGE